MHPPGRDPKPAIAERYAAKAARAERQGDHRRAAELYRAALRALEGPEECDFDPSAFAFSPGAEEATSGVRMRGENDDPNTIAPGAPRAR
jgi:hypothetical protein